MKRALALIPACALVVAALAAAAGADTLRKRYPFPYDRATRKASSMVAAKQARKKFLKDYLAEKFSPEIISRLGEQIDIALDPPDQYLTSFKVISEQTNADETQVTLTVEGEVALTEMVAALVQNKVLSFGREAPRVMVLPSPRFENPAAAKSLRALIFDKIKQAGLRPVAFDSVSETIGPPVKGKAALGEAERRALVGKAAEHGADYLIYIDAEVETKPFSQGGYISDANFIHTILRPNGDLILGEALVSERGSGSSPMLAFDRALDSIAPVIARVATGQLFEAIYKDSDVIYDTPKLREEKTLVIYSASPQLVEAIVDKLKGADTSATPTAGMSGVASRFKLETVMDDLELYEWFNGQSFTAQGKLFKAPVVGYSENVIEVEPVTQQAPARRKPIAKAPQPRPKDPPSGIPAGTQAVVLKLRRLQPNR